MTLSAVTAAEKNAPTAVIGPGRIIGTTTVLPSSTATVNKFLSIPYAVTPPKRFLLPERLTKYDGPLNATQLPHLCIQQNYGKSHPRAAITATFRRCKVLIQGKAHETPAQVAAESEDCLYLNIYTPADSEGGKAVMFWIHGGDLTSGTAVAFDGSSFAANHDVVVVIINYRLNGTH